ncbi:MAG: hypothetical protein NC335_10885 [Bacteroides sp.]|nr:hypothetical protein [Bacteroides sp.]
MKKILLPFLLLMATISDMAAKDLPQNAIPFILDSHIYIQATIADTVRVSLI